MDTIELIISLTTVAFGLGSTMAFFIVLIARIASRKRGSAYYGQNTI